MVRGGWAFGATYDAATTVEALSKVYSAKSVEFQINKGKGILNNASFASSHPGGANFAFVDASVKFISENISADVLKTIASTSSTEKPDLLEEE